MLRKLALTIIPVLGALVLTAGPASALIPKLPKPMPLPIPKVPGIPVPNVPVVNNWVPNAHHYHVMYRQLQWKTKNFQSHAAAHHFEDFMRSKGYQAHVQHHGDHYHVRYRFTEWRLYRTVFSHGQAHMLESQLEGWGYDAKVVHH